VDGQRRGENARRSGHCAELAHTRPCSALANPGKKCCTQRALEPCSTSQCEYRNTSVNQMDRGRRLQLFLERWSRMMPFSLMGLSESGSCDLQPAPLGPVTRAICSEPVTYRTGYLRCGDGGRQRWGCLSAELRPARESASSSRCGWMADEVVFGTNPTWRSASSLVVAVVTHEE